MSNKTGLYKGLLPDHFFECIADSEEDAQQKMKDMLLKQIQEGDELFIVWLESYVEVEQ